MQDAALVESALEKTGMLAAASLERARRLAAQTGERLDRVAVKLGLLAERDLASVYADVLGSPLATLADMPPQLEGALSMPAKFLRHARTMPLGDRQDGVEVAMADPFDAQSLRAMEFALSRPVLRRAAVPTDIETALDRLFGTDKPAAIPTERLIGDDEVDQGDLDRLRDLASEAPVIRLVNQIINRAVETRASDIHVEPTDGGIRVRYRVDGVLHDVESPPATLRAAIVSRLKILAKLDIAVRQLAQDGRIRLAVRGREVDFRVSTTPSIHGENVVLRILDRTNLKLDFEALGFDAQILERYLSVLTRPHGILLVTGPTGSGKTTTLYTSLSHLNAPETKILTVEDPVEYVLPGITQVQVKPQIGLTFASALRSFLRQDPDVMMIGEIRDLETAQIAVQAALTGHIVLSTIHTNEAASAVARLLDMGVEDYLLTSTVNGILAQRLVRTLCSCSQPYRAGPDLLERLGLPANAGEPIVFRRAVGCAACGGTGFAGRTMILELLCMSDALRSLVLKHAEAREIQAAALSEGMQTMFAHGRARQQEARQGGPGRAGQRRAIEHLGPPRPGALSVRAMS